MVDRTSRCAISIQWFIIVAAATVGPSCSAENKSSPSNTNPYQNQAGVQTGSAGIGGPTGGSITIAQTQGGSGPIVGAGGSNAGSVSEEQCSGISKKAEAELLPSDIIWAIDTSGSMFSSFPAIQTALNEFSAKMDAAGIDAHIILLAGEGSQGPGSMGGQGLCVPAPLGSGQCGPASQPSGPGADTKEPRFLHLDTPFGSTQGMAIILDNFGSYKHLLRSNARTQFVITEDGPPPITADDFANHVEGRAAAPAMATPAWNPPLQPNSWQFNGVVCPVAFGGGPCIFAFDVPTASLELIERTKGVLGDLQEAASGTSDPFGALLKKLAEAVIVGAKVGCEFEIPKPPDGMEFDADKVNVEYASGANAPTTVPRLPPNGTCDKEMSWSYDSPATPTHVVLCPSSCATVQNDSQARIDIKFGCKTVVILK